jgi:hypothetical protein
MPRRPLALVGAESSGRITAIEVARAQLFDVDADRKRRIDDAIDYFGRWQGSRGTTPASKDGQMPGLSNSDQTSEPERTILGRKARRASQSLEMVPEQRARRIWPYPLAHTWEATNGRNRSSSSPHPKQAQ